MGCVLACVALLAPRVTLFFIWALTAWFPRAYNTVVWPLLGFLFLPYTTLAYMAAMLHNNHRLTGWWIVLLVVAILFDLGSSSGSGASSRRKR